MSKQLISEAIIKRRKELNLSIRDLAARVNMKHPQIVRLTNGSDYRIATLLKVLDGLGLEIKIAPVSSFERTDCPDKEGN